MCKEGKQCCFRGMTWHALQSNYSKIPETNLKCDGNDDCEVARAMMRQHRGSELDKINEDNMTLQSS